MAHALPQSFYTGRQKYRTLGGIWNCTRQYWVQEPYYILMLEVSVWSDTLHRWVCQWRDARPDDPQVASNHVPNN